MRSHFRAAIVWPGSVWLALAAVLFLRPVHAATSPAYPCPIAGTPSPPSDAACASCHRAIYNRYEGTPMAQASGTAMSGLMQGSFTHRASGVSYHIFTRQGTAWLSYARSATAPNGYLSGEVELKYFVGSNTRGRTYLFERDGLWFEAPVNWYAKKRLWDMAPNFQNAQEMPLTLPVDANCLHCHATDVADPLPEARNRFAAAPFAHGGIGCSACHGDASEHLRTGGNAFVLNPARLEPVRRDSICLQCHLEGETAVYRPRHSLARFRPGQSIFNSVSYFVHQGEIGANGRATSQYEALLESACKRSSGDRLTCTTCHDPHGSETTASPAERIAYYRAKCLSCHTGATFKRDHHPAQPNCASCHMPRSSSEDIAHEQVTDHRIQLPADRNRAPATGAELELVDGQQVTDRERGLAYAQIAQRGDRASAERALDLLRKAEAAQSPAISDPELHTELGFLEEQSGDIASADREYRAALAADPNAGAARGDLAVLFAHTGDYATAVRLWQHVFDQDPSQTAAGYDLAVGECRLGQKEDAQTTLKILLRFSPDDQRARALASAIAGGAEHCAR